MPFEPRTDRTLEEVLITEGHTQAWFQAEEMRLSFAAQLIFLPVALAAMAM
jgi:hypothetical protein